MESITDFNKHRSQVGLEPVEIPSLPEVAPHRGIQRVSEYIESAADNSKEVHRKPQYIGRQAHRIRRRSWPWAIIVVIVVIAAVVGGTTGGILGHRSASTQPPPASTRVASSQSQSPAGAIPTAAPNVTTSAPPLRLISNTAIATVSCENGDRWIITQNVTGSLRGLYSNATNGHGSPWDIFPKDLNLTTARSNTPISASCVVVSPDLISANPAISQGLYLSIVYFDLASNLQQTVYNGNLWYNTPIFAASSPPRNTTKLCSSTNIITWPIPLPSTTVSTSQGIPTINPIIIGEFPDFVPPISSVVVYENTNRSLSMVNALYNFAGYPQVNGDLLASFNMIETLPVGASFSCVYNAPNPAQNVTQDALYSRFASTSWGEPPVLSIEDQLYLYANPATTQNQSEPIKPLVSNDSGCLYDFASYGSDVSLTLSYGNVTVLTYLDNNLDVSLAMTPTSSPLYIANATDSGNLCPDTINSTVNVPSSLFGAAACGWNSTSHCIYYQYNSTTLAQALYDLLSQSWADTILISM